MSCKTWSFLFFLEAGENSLFFLRVSPVLRLAHGNTWISPRRYIKDGYSCIIRIIVSVTKSTEFIHSKDVFFLTPSRWEAEKVFYWSSAKLQEQVHPEDKFSIRLVVFQPGRVTSKPLTFWTQTTLPFLWHGEQLEAALEEGIPETSFQVLLLPVPVVATFCLQSCPKPSLGFSYRSGETKNTGENKQTNKQPTTLSGCYYCKFFSRTPAVFLKSVISWLGAG